MTRLVPSLSLRARWSSGALSRPPVAAAVAAIRPCPTTPDGRSATVGVASGDLGTILVDSRGRTLYLFRRPGTRARAQAPAPGYWPPLEAKGKPTVGSGAVPRSSRPLLGPTAGRRSSTGPRSTSTSATRMPATSTAGAHGVRRRLVRGLPGRVTGVRPALDIDERLWH